MRGRPPPCHAGLGQGGQGGSTGGGGTGGSAVGGGGGGGGSEGIAAGGVGPELLVVAGEWEDMVAVIFISPSFSLQLYSYSCNIHSTCRWLDKV